MPLWKKSDRNLLWQGAFDEGKRFLHFKQAPLSCFPTVCGLAKAGNRQKLLGTINRRSGTDSALRCPRRLSAAQLRDITQAPPPIAQVPAAPWFP
jgi:hypothetical protein